MLAQEKRLEQVDGSLYSYAEYNNGSISQWGYYERRDGNYTPTGLWKNSMGTIAYYKDGELLWIKPKGQSKITKEQIEIHRLKSKVAKLEQSLTSL
jgi:hypothetical protein